MYSPGPVGYRIHIKRRRPGLIAIPTILGIGLVAYILYHFGFVPDSILNGLNMSAKNVTDNVPVMAKNNEASVLISRTNNRSPGKTGFSVPLEFQNKGINIINKSNSENSPLYHSETNTIPSTNTFNGDLGEATSESIFSEPEYFNFGMGSSGSLTTKEVIKKTAEDTLIQSKSIFYLIVSSVDTKELAEKQTLKFKNLADKAGYVYVPSLNKYRIYIDCYSSLKEASSNLKSFQKNNPSYKPWIWKN